MSLTTALTSVYSPGSISIGNGSSANGTGAAQDSDAEEELADDDEYYEVCFIPRDAGTCKYLRIFGFASNAQFLSNLSPTRPFLTVTAIYEALCECSALHPDEINTQDQDDYDVDYNPEHAYDDGADYQQDDYDEEQVCTIGTTMT